MTSRTDGENQTARTTFDAFGQIQTETDEVGNVTKYEQYDSNGLAQQVVTPHGVAADPDGNGGRWIYRYDTVGNVVSVTDPRAGAAATVADPGADFTTTLTYDALDRPTKTSSPKDSPSDDEPPPINTPDLTQIVRDTGYDLNYNVTSRTDAERNETMATFTPMDQLATVSSPGVPHGVSGLVSSETSRYVYEYDAKGSLTKLRDEDLVRVSNSGLSSRVGGESHGWGSRIVMPEQHRWTLAFRASAEWNP